MAEHVAVAERLRTLADWLDAHPGAVVHQVNFIDVTASMTGTELAKSGFASIDLISGDNFERVERVATGLAQSGVFKDVTSTQNAMAKILLGADLGLTPTQALMNLDVVEGNARVRSVLLGAWVRQHPDYDFGWSSTTRSTARSSSPTRARRGHRRSSRSRTRSWPGWSSRTSRGRRGWRTRATCCGRGR
jgi:hypothetical protein